MRGVHDNVGQHRPSPPRQRAESGASLFVKRLFERNWRLETTAMHGESTFDNPCEDPGVAIRRRQIHLA